jgi:Replication initiator protein A
MATIWDADVLIWAASQIVNARDAGLRTSRLMAATPIRDPDLRRPGRERQGLSAPQGQPRPAPVDDRRHLHPPGGRAPAPLFLDQRMERESRRQRPGARRRAHPARLVLRRRPRGRAGPDHRSRVFLANRRARALALPRRAQARRPAGVRLEFRPRASAREVRQPLAAQVLRLRHPRHRSPPARTRLLPCNRARAFGGQSASPSSHRPPTFLSKARVTANASGALGTTCEFPRAIGDRILVPSGSEIRRKGKWIKALARP